jgi:hypothetical protein
MWIAGIEAAAMIIGDDGRAWRAPTCAGSYLIYVEDEQALL